MLKVIKRNGTEVDFQKEKIINAISKAFYDVYGSDAALPDWPEYIATNIEYVAVQTYKDYNHWLTIENIQELVEDNLSAFDRLVEKAYIRYRYKRGVMRACSDEFIRAIGEKLRATNVQNQNANIDEHSFGGRVGEASDEMMKQYALDFCMSDMAKKNHLNNEIYIHDLSAYAVGMHNCLTIPFDDLLANGFNTRQTDVRPANSINTAFQLVAVIFQLQSLMQFGGVSASHLDWTMVPYVRKSFYKHYCDGLTYISQKDYYWIPGSIGDQKIEKDKWKDMSDFMCKWFRIDDEYGYSDEKAYQYAMDMTERELQQAVEGMYHNLNTLQSRSGN